MWVAHLSQLQVVHAARWPCQDTNKVISNETTMDSNLESIQKHECIITFSIVSQHQCGAGSVNSCSLKRTTCFSYIVNAIAGDAGSQGISSHDIDLVLQYSIFSTATTLRLEPACHGRDGADPEIKIFRILRLSLIKASKFLYNLNNPRGVHMV